MVSMDNLAALRAPHTNTYVKPPSLRKLGLSDVVITVKQEILQKIFKIEENRKNRKCWEEFQINRNSCLSRKSCIPDFGAKNIFFFKNPKTEYNDGKYQNF